MIDERGTDTDNNRGAAEREVDTNRGAAEREVDTNRGVDNNRGAAERGADRRGGPLVDPARLESLHRTCLVAAPDEALDRFARLVRSLLDVPVALVSLVDGERQFFPGQAGLAGPWAAKRETPLTHSFCQHVVAEGQPKVYPDARLDPQVRDNLAVPELGVVAYAGMPLTDLDGRVLGSLCAIDGRPRAWTAAELGTLADLAAACSSELRLRLALGIAEDSRQHAEDSRQHAEDSRQHAEDSRQHAEDSRREAEQAKHTAQEANAQLAMLAQLTETLAGTLEIDDALRRLAAAVTPRLADWCLISLIDDAGRLRQVAATHRDPTYHDDVRRFAELMTSQLGSRSVVLSVVRSGDPVLSDRAEPADILARTHAPEMAEIAARLGYASHLTVPITGTGRQPVVGTITLVNGPGRAPLSVPDLRTAGDIGRRAGLAIETSRMYGEQRHVAEVLQHSMLPELPTVEHLKLHASYLPTTTGAQVGGDWYDAFPQPGGDLMVAVGDVAGHDIEAAAAMGQLRNLVRGDAYGRDDPAGDQLTRLNRAVSGLSLPAVATVILARIRQDSTGYTLSWSNAGHPPPVLWHPDGTVEVLWTPAEPLLGLPYPVRRNTHHRRVDPGSVLLLYTDGLIEDRAALIDEGIDRLGRTLAANAGLPGDQLCAALVGGATSRTDDIALLLIRFPGPADG